MQQDDAFKKLLQSTQALAKNIQANSEQQLPQISPPAFPNCPPQPPAMPQQHMSQPFQGGMGDMYSPQNVWAVGAYLAQNMNSGNDTFGLRSVSLDSDMAYDGIEELLNESIFDDYQHNANAGNMRQMPTQQNHQRQ